MRGKETLPLPKIYVRRANYFLAFFFATFRVISERSSSPRYVDFLFRFDLAHAAVPRLEIFQVSVPRV